MTPPAAMNRCFPALAAARLFINCMHKYTWLPGGIQKIPVTKTQNLPTSQMQEFFPEAKYMQIEHFHSFVAWQLEKYLGNAIF